MHYLVFNRIAGMAVMPLVAMGGYAGYAYYGQPYQAPGNCVVISTNVTTITTTQVESLQHYFARQGYYAGNPNGQFDHRTRMALERFQADNGIPVTGSVDGQTRTVLAQVMCGGNPYPSPYPSPYPNPAPIGQLTLSMVSAPSSLSVGQAGTWKVRVSGTGYPSGQLTYTVTWGDEQYAGYGNAYAQQGGVNGTGTFTHAYAYAGIYHPTITVRDSYGRTAQASATVSVTNQNPYPCGAYSCGNYYPNPNYQYYPYQNGYPSGGSYPANCTTYYDRGCYQNGQYVGPDFGAGYPYDGPAAGASGAYYDVGTGTYYGNGNDYSCYYDRTCIGHPNANGN